jgi:GGDEF domain-containing protein
MNTELRLPEVLPLERFIRLLAHVGLVSAIVGDHYGVLVIELDSLEDIASRYGRLIADHCERILTRRMQEAMPADGLMTRLRPGAFGVLAFGATTEPEALVFATHLREQLEAPIPPGAPNGDLTVSVSIGVAFTSGGVRAGDPSQSAAPPVARVKLSGGAGTFVSRPGSQQQQDRHDSQVAAPAGRAVGNGAAA